MRIYRQIKLLLAGAVLTASLVPAQSGMKAKMRPAHYDPAKETTIQGTVEAVQTSRGIMMGVIVQLQVVRCSPVW